MGKTQNLGHLAHIVTYDAENHITIPAGITMHTNQLVASQDWVTTALGSYALSSALGSYVPTSRTITINGTTFDLSANRTFTIAAGLSSFNTRTGDVTLSSSDVTTALGYTPVTNARTITINGTTWDLSANRSFTVSAGTTLNGTGFVKASGTTITYDNSTYLTGITSALVTGALGFTPYNATNPSGFITSSALSAYLPLAGGTMTGNITFSNGRKALVGNYDAAQTQAIFAMGAAYVLTDGGASNNIGNLYGLAWSYNPDYGGVGNNPQSKAGLNHQLLLMQNGVTTAAMGSGIWTSGNISAANLSGTNTGDQTNISGNAAGNVLSRGQSNWSGSGVIDNVVGMLAWKNYNNSHVIFDASQGTSPSGSGVSQTNATYAWGASYPTLMGWNGGSTYGVRVDSARVADSAVSAGSASTATTADNLSGFNKSEPTFANVYNTGWFRNYGDSGLYNQDYGCHLRRNTSSSYGAWEIFGYTKGGYIGLNLIDPQGYWSNLMYENGSGGIYQQNGQSWHFYFFYGNDCLGLSGSETFDWVRACTNGKHRITNDTWCDATSFAYTFSNISDGRLKENIITVDSALDKVLQLRGVYYNWIIDTEQTKHIGLIAQETAAVCPEVVNYHDETDTYSVNYSELSGLFVESTKELNQKLMDANARIELLESKLNQLLNA